MVVLFSYQYVQSDRKSHFHREGYPFIHVSLFFSFSGVSWDLDLDVYAHAHSKSINRERDHNIIFIWSNDRKNGKNSQIYHSTYVNPPLLGLIQFNMSTFFPFVSPKPNLSHLIPFNTRNQIFESQTNPW